jgi:hypothetical protein
VTGFVLPSEFLLLQSKKIRWMDNVMKDIHAMEIVNWKRCAWIEINGSYLLSRPKLV